MKLVLQKISQEKSIPSHKSFKLWVNTVFNVLSIQQQSFEITIRIVDEDESARLNYYYRHKNRATNVLSFNFAVMPSIEVPIMGDIVICAPITIKEAKAQNKTSEEHFAHLTIHGVLHLLGHDHEKIQDAKKMEKLEVAILGELGYKNPLR